MAMPLCFREPIAELYECAALIRGAVDAHVAGNANEARRFLLAADSQTVRDWLNSIWGKSSKYVHFRTVPGEPPQLEKSQRLETRMPSMADRKALILRDGFVCRFCGLPVIRKEVRQCLHDFYPESLRWGRTNDSQHAGFQALWLQYDHILPHARGGTNDIGNMVVTCAACNYGRMNYTLKEVGLVNPLGRSPITTDWDGLEEVLSPGKRIALVAHQQSTFC